ncbi:MAG: hypothetical protein E6Q58_03655 [Niabella sp.]|nr:MAG: hypothetical protein E6Q58_03655 [Niabella sp.]
MFSKTLIKLIDYSIFPAVLIVAAKVIGIVFFINYFGVEYKIDAMRLILTRGDYFAVSTYSSIFAFAAILSGLIWVTVKAHVFHDTHISPAFSSRLYSMNLQGLVHSTEVIYTQSFIWLSYAWLATCMFFVHASFGVSAWWIFYVALAICAVATVMLVLDVEKEANFQATDYEDDEIDMNRKPVSFSRLKEEW